MLLCLTACLLLGPAQPPAKKNLGGVELVELPTRVQGYRTLQIAGFTVLADPKVVEPPEKLEKTPLEVLEAELKTIGRIVHAKALAELRKLTIWAEWDEEQGLGNGRQGKALAVYYGGSQRSMLAAGKNPLKANNITVLSTRDLAREHQPKRDSGRCVLLHEMVHAVHHKILGFENPKIEAAYRQALASGKLERGSYAATNAAEFFAEMSCAYLDKLGYYPRDKEELKKHDPSTFQLMSVIWSGGRCDGSAGFGHDSGRFSSGRSGERTCSARAIRATRQGGADPVFCRPKPRRAFGPWKGCFARCRLGRGWIDGVGKPCQSWSARK
jgi:hypothetical protein